MRDATILGATGSIGKQAIAFLRLHRDEFRLVTIAVGKDFDGGHHRSVGTIDDIPEINRTAKAFHRSQVRQVRRQDGPR